MTVLPPEQSRLWVKVLQCSFRVLGFLRLTSSLTVLLEEPLAHLRVHWVSLTLKRLLVLKRVFNHTHKSAVNLYFTVC